MVSRDTLLRNTAILRNLFTLVGLDVTSYSDDAIADAMLASCPVVGDDWPTDAQLRAIVAQLRNSV